MVFPFRAAAGGSGEGLKKYFSSDPTYKLLWKYPAYKLVCSFANIYPNTVVLDHLAPRMSSLCDLAAHKKNTRTFWTRGSRVIVPGVKLPQNELIRWILPTTVIDVAGTAAEDPPTAAETAPTAPTAV